jgi:GNAT superfamily N-acetyltransferase
MFIIRQCDTEDDYASARELAAELAAWDIAQTQKLGITADEVAQFYYPTDGELPSSADAAPGAMLLARAASIPAACVGYRELDSHSCELKRLYVRPAFRGAGLGKMMISSLVERATRAGYSRMFLETTHFMNGAIRLYEEAGFVPCDAYYAIPDTFRDISIFMKKDLGAS